jgi:hypothetical protein
MTALQWCVRLPVANAFGGQTHSVRWDGGQMAGILQKNDTLEQLSVRNNAITSRGVYELLQARNSGKVIRVRSPQASMIQPHAPHWHTQDLDMVGNPIDADPKVLALVATQRFFLPGVLVVHVPMPPPAATTATSGEGGKSPHVVGESTHSVSSGSAAAGPASSGLLSAAAAPVRRAR